jgi:hypothetical protein
VWLLLVWVARALAPSARCASCRVAEASFQQSVKHTKTFACGQNHSLPQSLAAALPATVASRMHECAAAVPPARPRVRLPATSPLSRPCASSSNHPMLPLCSAYKKAPCATC